MSEQSPTTQFMYTYIEIATPGKTYQEILDECNECNCCDEHKRAKPTSLDFIPIDPFASSIDTGIPKVKSCKCHCRQTARMVCRIYGTLD
jgi:hypothetical protein